MQWEDKTTGLPCLAVRNRFGAWCGYVGIPREHPFHGKSYRDLDAHDPPVHGGLTFTDRCDPDAAEAEGICHVPGPGEPDDVWWLGFDCGHIGDVQPRMIAYHQEILDEIGTPEGWLETYKTLDYVQAQCAELAVWCQYERRTP